MAKKIVSEASASSPVIKAAETQNGPVVVIPAPIVAPKLTRAERAAAKAAATAKAQADAEEAARVAAAAFGPRYRGTPQTLCPACGLHTVSNEAAVKQALGCLAAQARKSGVAIQAADLVPIAQSLKLTSFAAGLRVVEVPTPPKAPKK